MNRLILVGNGFDLAHGLKTSYKDFIIWYLAESLGQASYLPKTYQDKLVEIQFCHYNDFISIINAHKPGNLNLKITKEDLNNFIIYCFEKQIIKEFMNIRESDVHEFITSSSFDSYDSNHYQPEPFKFRILSNLLRSLIINCQDCNWVDIENEYFDQLKACKSKDGLFDKEKVRQLNSEFAYLKQKLEEYLTLQQEQADIKIIPELLEAIKSDFEISDFDSIVPYEDVRNKLGYDRTITTQIQHNLYFLNFNYTNTLLKYEEELKKSRGKFDKIKINYIHGELNQSANRIIFGFGDERDKTYLEFEEDRNNQLFEHIKSYQYLLTPNYRNLLRFLEEDDFQVFVMGHSCGLSDRTMFKEIFEHENCKSIRLFHYNKDFHDKAINVSKHFSNKGHMRKLIVDYKASDAFPQANVN
jgi:Bacteriophage abortive infection AbiH